MNLPKRVRIGGCDIEISTVDSIINEDEFTGGRIDGRWTEDLQEIEIRTETKEKEFSNQYMLKIFLHELVHAVDSVYNHFSLEEEQVVCFTSGLYTFLTENTVDFYNKDLLRFPKFLFFRGVKYKIVQDETLEGYDASYYYGDSFVTVPKIVMPYHRKKILIGLLLSVLGDDVNSSMSDVVNTSLIDGFVQLLTDVDFKTLIKQAQEEDMK